MGDADAVAACGVVDAALSARGCCPQETDSAAINVTGSHFEKPAPVLDGGLINKDAPPHSGRYLFTDMAAHYTGLITLGMNREDWEADARYDAIVRAENV